MSQPPIKWHFNNPGKARPPQPGRPGASKPPASKPPNNGDKQAQGLLSLMMRGKQRAAEAAEPAATNRRPSSAPSNPWGRPSKQPKLSSKNTSASSGSGASAEAGQDDLDPLLETLIAMPAASGQPEPAASGGSAVQARALEAVPSALAEPKPSTAQTPAPAPRAASAAEPPPPRLPAPPQRQCVPAPPAHRPPVISGLVVATGTGRDEDMYETQWVQLLPDAPRAVAQATAAAAAAGNAQAGGAGGGAAETGRHVGGGGRGGGAVGVDARLVHGWGAGDVLHIELRDEWLDTPCRPGDRANLVGDLLPSCGCEGCMHPRCTLLRRGHPALLVLRPEHLVTGTALSQGTSCARKATLARAAADPSGK